MEGGSRGGSRVNSGRASDDPNNLPYLTTPGNKDENVQGLLKTAISTAKQELDVENKKFQQDLLSGDALRQTAFQKQVDELEAQRGQFAARNAQMQRELSELKQQRFDIGNQSERKDMELDLLKTRLAEIEHAQRKDRAKEANICAALAFSRNDNETLRAKVVKLEQEISSLQSEKVESAEMVEKVHDLEKALEDEHKLRNNVHQVSNEEVTRLHATIQELRDDCADQRQRYVLLMLQKKNLEKDVTGYRDYATQLRERCDMNTDELWARLQASEQIQTKVQDDNYALKLEMDKLRWNRQEEKYRMESEINTLRAALRKYRTEKAAAAPKKEPQAKVETIVDHTAYHNMRVELPTRPNAKSPRVKSPKSPKAPPEPVESVSEADPDKPHLAPHEWAKRYPDLTQAQPGDNRNELRISMDIGGQPPNMSQVLGNTDRGGWSDRSRWGHHRSSPSAPGWNRAQKRVDGSQNEHIPSRRVVTPPVTKRSVGSFDWRQSLDDPWSVKRPSSVGSMLPSGPQLTFSTVSTSLSKSHPSLSIASPQSKAKNRPGSRGLGKENSNLRDEVTQAQVELLEMLNFSEVHFTESRVSTPPTVQVPTNGSSKTPNPDNFESSTKFKRFQMKNDKSSSYGVQNVVPRGASSTNEEDSNRNHFATEYVPPVSARPDQY